MDPKRQRSGKSVEKETDFSLSDLLGGIRSMMLGAIRRRVTSGGSSASILGLANAIRSGSSVSRASSSFLVGSKTLRGIVSRYSDDLIVNWSKPFSTDSGTIHNQLPYPSDVEDTNEIAELPSGASFDENGVEDVQIDHSAPGTEAIGLEDPFPSDINDTEYTQMGSSASESEDEVVYEIDVAKLENVLSLLQSSVDGSLGSSLDDMNLDLDEEFVVRVLETPHILGENLIDFYKWASNKEELKVTARVVHALASAVCACPSMRDAHTLWDLIKEIGAKNIILLSAETLNKLIAMFSQLGEGKVAFEVYNKFEEFGCARNAETYYSTIVALCKRSLFDCASSVSENMLNEGIIPDSEKVGKIISSLCKGKKVKDAHLVYMSAKDQNKYPPQFSVNFLISSLSSEDENVKSALEILGDFSGDTRKYAINPFSSVISGLCRIKDMNGAKKLLAKMITDGPPPGNAVFNSIISGYSKDDDMARAEEIMRTMKSRGLRPDVYTYTVIISGYTKGGQMEDARRLLSDAKKKHTKLSPVLYHTLIRGYCKLEQFGNALKMLNAMKKSGVQPNADEYTKLIQSLCMKALDWKTAEKLLTEMEEKKIYLNGITRGLIRAVKDLEEETEAREVPASL